MSSCSDEEGTEGGGHCGGVGGYSYGWIFFFVGFLLGQFVCCCLFLFFSKFVSNISSSGFIISLISIISRLISIIIRLCRLGDSCTSSEVSAFGIFVVSFLLLSSSTGGSGLSFEKVDSRLRSRFREVFGTPDSIFITSSGGLLGYKASCIPNLIFCNLVIFICLTGHEFSEEVNL